MTPDISQSLTVSNLTAGYRTKTVIRDLTLPLLRAGELTALVGPNAAGKSTLLRAIAGLIPATGTLAFGEQDLRKLSAAERSSVLGFMPQSLPSGTALSVLESVITALMASRSLTAAMGDAEERAYAILDRLGISDFAMSPLDHLSGGQRQVISLAQAIAREPKIVLLDEPTSALDLARQFHVMRMVKSVAREGRIAVVVMHDLALAAQWADHIVVLNQGKLNVAGSPAQAITSKMLRQVYRINARVERCSQGRLQIMTDDVAWDDGNVSPRLQEISK